MIRSLPCTARPAPALAARLRHWPGVAFAFLAVLASGGPLAAQSPPVRRAEPVRRADPARGRAPAAPPVKRAELVPEEPEEPAGAPKPRPAERGTKPAPAKGSRSSPEKNLFDYANMCYGQKAYDLSLQQYSEYIRVYPRGEFAQVAMYRLGESYLNLKQVNDAEAAYKQLIDRFRTGDYVANAAYRIASLAYNKREFAAAVPFFDLAATNTKQDRLRASALYYKGRCLVEDGRPRNAANDFEKLAETRKDNPYWERATLQLARMDKSGGRSKESLEHYQKLSDQAVDPDVRAEALVEAGGILSETGKDAEAVASFQKVLQIKSEKANTAVPTLRAIARYGLIEIHYKAGQWQKVLDSYHLTESLQVPENLRPAMWLRIGESHRHLKQWRRAIDVFLMIDQYFPTSPQNAEAGFRRLLCLNEIKDPSMPAEAAKVIQRIRAIDPKSEQIDLCRFLVAENYFVRGEYKDAAQTYSDIRAEKIPEKFRGALAFHRGWASAEAGQNSSAIAAFTQFIESQPKDPQVPAALAKRGMAAKAADDLKTAAADFDRLIAEYGDSSYAEFAYEQAALVKGQRKDVPGMITAFQELLKKFPNSKAAPGAWFWIGSGYFDLKQFEQAVPPLEKARQLDARNYEKEAGLKILLSYYYLQDVPKLVKAVESERMKDGADSRIPQPVYQFLGLKFFELEDMAAADKYLSLASTPKEPMETDYRVWAALAEARLANQRFESALTAAENYLQKGDLPPPQKAKGMLNKATALYHLRRFDEATPLLNEALRLQPEARVQAFLRLLLGDIALARGEFDHAAAVYVVPSQMFDDPGITPLALWKTVQALNKAGKSQQAEEYRIDLEKRFPKFQPPPEIKPETRSADI